jgi:hypothetical protein
MGCRRPLILTSLLALAGVSLLTAGCGDGSPRSTAATTTRNKLVDFARCMRAGGVSNFPDPNSRGNFLPLSTQALGVSKRTTVAAKNHCEHLLPPSFLGGSPETAQQKHARLALGLSFANCMRARGIANFPDPNSQGNFPPLSQSALGAGIDLHQPALLQAALACAPVTHGLITRAALERAGNGG